MLHFGTVCTPSGKHEVLLGHIQTSTCALISSPILLFHLHIILLVSHLTLRTPFSTVVKKGHLTPKMSES